jgi:hypothetical protein
MKYYTFDFDSSVADSPLFEMVRDTNRMDVESAVIMVSARRVRLPGDEVEEILDERPCDSENSLILVTILV